MSPSPATSSSLPFPTALPSPSSSLPSAGSIPHETNSSAAAIVGSIIAGVVVLGVAAIIAFTYYKLKIRSKPPPQVTEIYHPACEMSQLRSHYLEDKVTSMTSTRLSDGGTSKGADAEGSRALVLRGGLPVDAGYSIS